MIVKIVKEKHDTQKDCEILLREIKDNLSPDFPEIRDYLVEG